MVSNKPKVSYITVEDEFSGQRLDNFLLRELKGVPRSLIYRIVRRGEVRVNEGRTRAHKRLQKGDRVRIPPLRMSVRKPVPGSGLVIAFDTLFEDEHLLVIDKPAGIAVHAGSGIPWGLIEFLRQSRPEQRFLELVHRLDRDTSGCLIMAKRRGVLRRLHQDLRQDTDRKNRVRKKYQALVAGNWAATNRVVEMPLRKNAERSGERMVIVADDGMYARSRFTTLQRFGHSTLMEITLITGRTHQARVHAAASGHPILGDVKYGDMQGNSRFKSIGLGRLFLHASYLSFVHPATAQRIEFVCPLPKDLENVIHQLIPDRHVV
ncbi:RluA family pseudouridine synthase [Gammaproteobacteria bacterium]|nr:RluA family pseudouridine synthase [Gammaproteobacteria bacterium]